MAHNDHCEWEHSFKLKLNFFDKTLFSGVQKRQDSTDDDIAAALYLANPCSNPVIAFFCFVARAKKDPRSIWT